MGREKRPSEDEEERRGLCRRGLLFCPPLSPSINCVFSDLLSSFWGMEPRGMKMGLPLLSPYSRERGEKRYETGGEGEEI